jgi:hypothetical protein
VPQGIRPYSLCPVSRVRSIERFSPETFGALRLTDQSNTGPLEVRASARLKGVGVRSIEHLQRGASVL